MKRVDEYHLLFVFIFLFCFITICVPAFASENTLELGDRDELNIVVLTNLMKDSDEKLCSAAVDTICDELQITGFNVTKVKNAAPFQDGLKSTIDEALLEYRAFIAIAITQSSMKDGNVMLFFKDSDEKIKNLESIYIEFPLSKDKAELVAFRVSEKAALLSDSLNISVSIDDDKETNIPARHDVKQIRLSEELSKSKHHMIGVFAMMGGEYSRGGIGTFAGPGIGARLRSIVNMVFDLELRLYIIGNDLKHEFDELTMDYAAMDFTILKLRAAYSFSFGKYFFLNTGISLGAAYLWVTGKSYSNTATKAQNVDIRKQGDIFAYGGGSVELVFNLFERLWIPLRFELGAFIPNISIVFGKSTDGVLEKQPVASFKIPIVEFSIGIIVNIF